MSIAGAVILVAAAYFCGGLIASREGEKLKAIDNLIQLLQYLRRRMEVDNSPLYVLFGAYKNDYLESQGFLSRLRSFGNRASCVWGEALDLLELEEGAKAELLNFGEGLGRLDLPTQIKSIDSCLAMLEQERQRLRVAVPMKQKSTKAVALLSGALTAIILI